MKSKALYQFKIYLVNDPKNRRFVVSEKLERELRGQYRAFELLATKHCTKKEVYRYTKQMMKVYRVKECDFCFYVPRVDAVGFNNQPFEVQERIREKASKRAKGRVMTAEHKRKISATMKSLGLKRPHLVQYRLTKFSPRKPFNWIYNIETGVEKQIAKDSTIPPGWLKGRPSINEIHKYRNIT